jgi:ElaA protein
LYSILAARAQKTQADSESFGCDFDGRDEGAMHIFALDTQGGKLRVLAYGRILSDPKGREVVIDKLLTCTRRRVPELSDALMTRAFAAVLAMWPDRPVRFKVAARDGVLWEGFSVAAAHATRKPARRLRSVV